MSHITASCETVKRELEEYISQYDSAPKDIDDDEWEKYNVEITFLDL